MPNYITNILTFEGDSEQVYAMLDKIKSDELGLGSIDFNKIIPRGNTHRNFNPAPRLAF